jgi:hypothetical protein
MRSAGLSDAEYLWEQAADAWSVRPRDWGTTPLAAGYRKRTV